MSMMSDKVEKGREISGSDGQIAAINDVGDEFDPDAPEDFEVSAGGALRVNGDGDRFWLNLDQLTEFNRMDRTIESDPDFFDWFDEAIAAWGLNPRSGKAHKRGMLPSLSNWGGWKSTPLSDTKKYLSDWWGGASLFSAWSGDQARKLATALGVVKTTIRVVDNHARPMTVQLANDEEAGKPSSYTSYDERVIQVSPMALLDTGIEEGEGIDITTGFALHEASHAEHSEPTLSALTQPTTLRPVSIAFLLHNVLEDVRIEELTSEVFPGFAGYFQKARDYIWTLQKEHVPTKWGPSLEDKVRGVVAACKWFNDLMPVAEEDLRKEAEWWHEWVERYHRGEIKAREALVKGLERLAEDPKTKAEMARMEREEKAQEAAGSDLRETIGSVLKGHKLDKIGACTSNQHGEGVHDPSGKRKPGVGPMMDQVNRLVRSEIEAGTIKDFHLPELSGANPTIVVLHEPTPMAPRRVNRSLVARMKTAFFFRPSARQWTDKLMKTGFVDEDELWRAGLGDYRVFEQRNIESTPDAHVTLLIDASGSMRGTVEGKVKLSHATDMAEVMLACLNDMPGVNVKVRAHTADSLDCGSGNAAVYRIWERGEPLNRTALIETINHSDNMDGYAIGWCVKEMLEEAGANEQKLVIVLSDGYPAGNGYSGRAAMDHVRDTVRWAEKQGVEVVQVAISEELTAARQGAMFKHWVPFRGGAELPAQMTALLKRVFPSR